MTISIPLKLEVTATLRAETSACTASFAPGCCSRLISPAGVCGASLATGGGAFWRRCACVSDAASARNPMQSVAMRPSVARLPSSPCIMPPPTGTLFAEGMPEKISWGAIRKPPPTPSKPETRVFADMSATGRWKCIPHHTDRPTMPRTPAATAPHARRAALHDVVRSKSEIGPRIIRDPPVHRPSIMPATVHAAHQRAVFGGYPSADLHPSDREISLVRKGHHALANCKRAVEKTTKIGRGAPILHPAAIGSYARTVRRVRR